MLDAFALLLFPKIFRHNYRKPNIYTIQQEYIVAGFKFLQIYIYRTMRNSHKINFQYLCVFVSGVC